MRAADARPGDVVLDQAGTYWKRGITGTDWAIFGPVTYQPHGDLTLLARNGRPVTAHRPDSFGTVAEAENSAGDAPC